MAGIAINEASLITKVNGNERIPVFDGTLNPVTITPNNLLAYLLSGLEEVINRLGINEIEDFDESKSYLPNDLTVYEGKVYKFIDNHSGPWSNLSVTLTTLYNEFKEVYNFTEEVVSGKIIFDDSVAVGTFPLTFSVVYLIDESIHNISTDLSGNFKFSIPKGITYKIVFPNIQGFRDPYLVVYKAIGPSRYITPSYRVIKDSLEGISILNIYCVRMAYENNIYTKQNTDFENQNLLISYELNGKSKSLEKEISLDGKVLIEIPLNAHYTITFPTINNYYTPSIYSSYASIPNVFVEGQYYHYGEIIQIVDLNGNYYKADTWETAKTQNPSIIPKALFINPEVLQNPSIFNYKSNEDKSDSLSFFIELGTSGILTAGSTTWSNETIFCRKTESEADSWPIVNSTNPNNNGNFNYSASFDGKQETKLILESTQWLREHNHSAYTTNAARLASYTSIDVNVSNPRILLLGDKTYHGFLPSIGQLWVLRQLKSSIDLTLGILFGPSSVFNIQTGGWWSSTLYSVTNSWYLSYGSPSNGNKTYSYQVLPLFAL